MQKCNRRSVRLKSRRAHVSALKGCGGVPRYGLYPARHLRGAGILSDCGLWPRTLCSLAADYLLCAHVGQTRVGRRHTSNVFVPPLPYLQQKCCEVEFSLAGQVAACSGLNLEQVRLFHALTAQQAGGGRGLAQELSTLPRESAGCVRVGSGLFPRESSTALTGWRWGEGFKGKSGLKKSCAGDWHNLRRRGAARRGIRHLCPPKSFGGTCVWI